MNWKFWHNIKTSERKQSFVLDKSGDSLPSWSQRDYENFAKESYMKNVIAYACIDKIAKAVSTVPWWLYTISETGEKKEIFNHYFNRILDRANIDQSWMMLLYGATSYLAMAGNLFFEKVTTFNGIPQELYTLQPDKMNIMVDRETKAKTAYVYEDDGEKNTYEIDEVSGECDVLHIKTFHPTNDLWGLAPTEPGARKIDASNSMDDWNKKLMENSGKPGLLYFFEGALSDEQFDHLKKQITQSVEGAENAGKSLILEGARDAKPYGFTPSEMDWINSNKELARSICTSYGVPPQLVGLPDVSTYSNYHEARSAFYEDTITFYLALIKSELNAWLFNKETIRLGYKLDEVPAMQYKETMRWERAEKSSFLTINEKRALVGHDEIDSGDVLLVPANLLPLGEDFSDVGDEDTSRLINLLLEKGFSDCEIKSIMAGPLSPEEKPFANEHACRLENPSKFDKIRRENNWKKIDGKRVDAIWGIKNGKTSLQSMRFPKDEWSASEARKYCNEKNGSFEAAKNK